MKRIDVCEVSLLVFSVCLITQLVGCSQKDGPDPKQGVGDSNQLDSMGIITNRGGAPHELLERAFEQLRAGKGKELPPSWWVKLINDETYPREHREHCLAEYLRLHAKTPISVQRFGEVDGIREWLAKDTVFDASRGSFQGIAPEFGKSMVVVRPRFSRLARRGLGIFIHISPNFAAWVGDPDEAKGVAGFLEAVHGKRSVEKLQITRIDFSFPWEDELNR